jgi:hypothetical protein
VASPAAPIRAARTGGQGRRPRVARTVQSPNVRGLAMWGPRPGSKTGPAARMAQVTATSPTASRSSEEGTGAGGRGAGNREAGGRGAGNRGAGGRGAGNREAGGRGAGNRKAGNREAGSRGADGIGIGVAGKAGTPRSVGAFTSVETKGWGGQAMGKEKASGVPVGGWPRASSGSGVNGGGPGGGSPRARRPRARRPGGVRKSAGYSRSPKIAGSTSIPMGQ